MVKLSGVAIGSNYVLENVSGERLWLNFEAFLKVLGGFILILLLLVLIGIVWDIIKINRSKGE